MHDARENYERLLLEIKEGREWHATRTAYILLEQLDEEERMIATSANASGTSLASSTSFALRGIASIDSGQLISPTFRSVLARVNARIQTLNEWDEPTHSDASDDPTEPITLEPSEPEQNESNEPDSDFDESESSDFKESGES